MKRDNEMDLNEKYLLNADYFIKDLIEQSNDSTYFPDVFIKYLNNYYYDLASIPNAPLYVTWNFTNRCNLSCFFCSANSRQCKDKNEVNKEQKIKIAYKLIEW